MTISKLEAVIALCVAIASPITTYYTAIGEIKQSQAADRLEAEKRFVQRDELKVVNEKLDKLAEGVGEIKGYLRVGGLKPLSRSVSSARLYK